MKLSEKYRPMDWPDFVGQDKAVRKIQAYVATNRHGGRVFLFQGESGSGKTSAAMCVCKDLGIAEHRHTLRQLQNGAAINLRFVNGRDMDLATVEEVNDWLQHIPFGPEGCRKALVVDEAQEMTRLTQNRLLTVFEIVPEFATVILTTTDARRMTRDAKQGDLLASGAPDRKSAFGSRLTVIHFEKPHTEKITARLEEIAFKETGNGVGFDYKTIIRLGGCNVRACIDALDDQIIEAMAQGGEKEAPVM